MKRILTIQDISCIGKCSLTVALPVISSFGVECGVLPTAVLSAHTAFNGFTFHDLTDDLEKVTKHWQDQKIEFDALYTGYLGSFRQLDIVSKIFDNFKTENNFILVDPVMADNGKLYPGFDESFAFEMAKLCKKADIIVPNLTEACFMLNHQYIDNGYSEDYIRDILIKLTDLGADTAIITGVKLNDKDLGAYGYTKSKNEFFSYFKKHLPKSFHGTGDIFASSLCGSLTQGKDIKKSLQIAVDFTVKCIKNTINNPAHNWYGVDFESALPYLIKKIN